MPSTAGTVRYQGRLALIARSNAAEDAEPGVAPPFAGLYPCGAHFTYERFCRAIDVADTRNARAVRIIRLLQQGDESVSPADRQFACEYAYHRSHVMRMPLTAGSVASHSAWYIQLVPAQ